MLTNGTQSDLYFKSLFNDFTAGIIEKEFNDNEINYIIEIYFKSSQKHINRRDGVDSKRIELLGLDDDFIYLSADTKFKYPKSTAFSFMKQSALKNKNSLITNAFRQATKDGFEACIEIKEVY